MFLPNADLKRHMIILGLTNFPYTERTLKLAFRKKAIETHPDTNQSTNTSNFRKISDSYQFLMGFVSESIDEIEAFKPIPFDELPDRVYDICPNCDGRGFKKVEHTMRANMDICPYCDPFWEDTRDILLNRRSRRRLGTIKIPCKACDHGLFTLRSGRKVKCKNCHGKGFRWEKCPKCGGTGILYEKINSTEIVKCGTCRGHGKVDVTPFNPALRKLEILIK